MQINQPGSDSSLTVTDGITTVLNTKELSFSGATVTDGGGGIADITITGGYWTQSGSTLYPTTTSNRILLGGAVDNGESVLNVLGNIAVSTTDYPDGIFSINDNGGYAYISLGDNALDVNGTGLLINDYSKAIYLTSYGTLNFTGNSIFNGGTGTYNIQAAGLSLFGNNATSDGYIEIGSQSSVATLNFYNNFASPTYGGIINIQSGKSLYLNGALSIGSVNGNYAWDGTSALQVNGATTTGVMVVNGTATGSIDNSWQMDTLASSNLRRITLVGDDGAGNLANFILSQQTNNATSPWFGRTPFVILSSGNIVIDPSNSLNVVPTDNGNALQVNGAISNTSMPTADPADGNGTLWYDTLTNLVHRGT